VHRMANPVSKTALDRPGIVYKYRLSDGSAKEEHYGNVQNLVDVECSC